MRKEIDQFGNVYYYNEHDQLHREDGPAIEYANGDKYWYQNGKYHREDGPAIERVNGNKFWHQNGKYHREDGPAIEYANGDKVWYHNNELLGFSSRDYTQKKFEQWLKIKAFQ